MLGKFQSFSIFLILFFFLFPASIMAGCTSRYAWDPKKSREALLVPKEISNSIEISQEKHEYEEKLVEESKTYECYEISILMEGKACTRLLWYRCKSQEAETPRPVDFIWPILADRKMRVEKLLATDIFVPLGMDAVILCPKESLLSTKKPRPLSQFKAFHEERVRDLLRAILWAKTKSELDSKKFGMSGVSYGGMMTAGCIPFTQDFVSYKIVMGGGCIKEILLQSEEKRVVEWREVILGQLEQEVRVRFAAEAKQTKEKLEISEKFFQTEARKLFLEQADFGWDPIQFAMYGDPQKIAMVVTLLDRCVPSKNQLDLWKALGKPDALFVTTGHYTLLLAYLQVKPFLMEMAKKHYGKK